MPQSGKYLELNFLNEHSGNEVLISFSLYTRLGIMLTIFRKGKFVNNDANALN